MVLDAQETLFSSGPKCEMMFFVVGGCVMHLGTCTKLCGKL